jgi:hypothetical protein
MLQLLFGCVGVGDGGRVPPDDRATSGSGDEFASRTCATCQGAGGVALAVEAVEVVGVGAGVVEYT